VRLEITAHPVHRSGQPLVVRALVFNDSYWPIALSRNAFLGPNLNARLPNGMPVPPSVEATYTGQDEPMTLQPFTFYGRERSFEDLPPGEYEFTAEYQSLDESERLSFAATFTVPETTDTSRSGDS
jgi:hypothetical protein